MEKEAMESSRGLGPGWLCVYALAWASLGFPDLNGLRTPPHSQVCPEAVSATWTGLSSSCRGQNSNPSDRMQGRSIHSFPPQHHCPAGRGGFKVRLEDGRVLGHEKVGSGPP